MHVFVKSSARNNVETRWAYAAYDKELCAHLNSGTLDRNQPHGLPLSHVTGYAVAMMRFLSDLEKAIKAQHRNPSQVKGTIVFHCSYKQIEGALMGNSACQSAATQKLMQMSGEFRTRHPHIRFEFSADMRFDRTGEDTSNVLIHALEHPPVKEVK